MTCTHTRTDRHFEKESGPKHSLGPLKILRQEIRKYEKMENSWNEPYQRKDYFSSMTVDEIRIKFRFNTRMIDSKFNFKNKNNYRTEMFQCDSCIKSIESQTHLLWCPAYENLREGKSLNSDKDLVKYIQEVLIIRDKLNLDR